MKLTCPVCGSDMVRRWGSRSRGYYWRCARWPLCQIKWSEDRNGNLVGKPSDRKTRYMRCRVHAVFDQLWKQGWLSREGAYEWAAHNLGLSKEQAHIGLLDHEQCKKLLRLSREVIVFKEKEGRKSKRVSIPFPAPPAPPSPEDGHPF